MTDLSVVQLPEPLLAFGSGQKMEGPKDGLFLFGPEEDAGGRSEIRVGIIGTEAGIGLCKLWFDKISKPIAGPVDENGAPKTWAPSWPGFQACFGAKVPSQFASVKLDAVNIDSSIKKNNRADAVRSTVLMFADAIRKHLRNEEHHPDVWMVVVPDIVHRYGRPQVAMPPVSERTQSDLVSKKAAEKFFAEGDLFPDEFDSADAYLYSNDFHHQLKAELLKDNVALQLALESTLTDRRVLSDAGRVTGLQDEATVAWNFGTTLYFKTGSRPWSLADVREGVCYVGLVFKNNDSSNTKGEACCAAQMFLDSGDGIVFRGALGPWYSNDSREYHLSESAARSLMDSVIEGYTAKHDGPPKELFIHGRHFFDDYEWNGFKSAVPEETNLVGVRITSGDDVRLFRPNSSKPVLRGTALVVTPRHGFLWARGYVPRLSAYQGFETPKPLAVQITRGEAYIEQVMEDVLGLTKVNYNACDFASGVPVTLKFADRVGDILMASPHTAHSAPLPFRFYI